MKVVFLGTGEEFHDTRRNTSVLIEARTNVLMDCGFNIPQRVWQRSSSKDMLDCIFISHFHADHVAGLPSIIARMVQDGRRKPLTIIGPDNVEKDFRSLYESLYRNFMHDVEFPLEFIEARETQDIELPGMKLSFTYVDHLSGTPYFIPTAAIRVDSHGNSVCYSADTVYSRNLVALAKGCDILIHDAYLPAESEYHKRVRSHASPKDAGRAARLAGARKLLLTNIHRDFEYRADEIINEAKTEYGGEVIIPFDGQYFSF